MIDLNKYDLIKNNENNSYYNIQKDLIAQYRKSGKIDYIVQLALLMIATPISDYYQSIRILYDCVISEDNYLAYVIGSYLSSTWLPFEPNRFLRRLKERKGQFEFRIEEDLENYLNAYDIYMRANEGWKNQCIKLLRKSIDNSSMVNNYILLSKLVERGEAKKLIKIAEENRTIQIENKENGGINEICDPWKYINCEIKGYQ